MKPTTHTILLVEDDENDTLFMRMALETAGIAAGLQVADDGERAINYLSGAGEYADRAKHPLPALVLLDLKLPRVLGLDVLEWIREKPEFDMMVVIVLTSSLQRADIRRAWTLRANSYLVKPANPLHLTEMMELVKRFWLKLNQPTAASVALALPTESN